MFSVVIPTCNRNEMLGLCLDRLAPVKQYMDGLPYEVIVSDDGQGFPAEHFCRENYPWVRYTRGSQKGPAANRNNGSRLAKEDWLVFLDDDCIPDTTLLSNYLVCINKNPDCRVFEGCIYAIGSQTAFNEECPVNETGGLLWSCNFCMDKSFYDSLGGFDEKFMYATMEDIDLRHRIERESEFVFCRQARVGHPWKKIEMPFQRFERAFLSHLIYLQKWPMKDKKFGFISHFRKILFHLINVVIPNFFRFKGKGFSYVLAYYYFLIRLAFHQIKKGVL